MNLSRTTLKKAYPYLGICEFCGGILELSYYDFVLECAVCEECAGDLAAGENALAAVGIASPGPEYWSFHNLGDVTAFKKRANQGRAFRHSF